MTREQHDNKRVSDRMLKEYQKVAEAKLSKAQLELIEAKGFKKEIDGLTCAKEIGIWPGDFVKHNERDEPEREVTAVELVDYYGKPMPYLMGRGWAGQAHLYHLVREGVLEDETIPAEN